MEVFVYGTLTDPDRVGAVVDEFSFRGSAVLRGLRRVPGRHPTLAPGDAVRGRILRTPEVAALDRYEGVTAGLYVRVAVPVADPAGGPETTDAVATYVGDPARLGVDAAVSWPGSGPLRERVERYLAREDVVCVRE